MKVISEFFDYYDNIFNDNSIVYNRIQRKIKLNTSINNNIKKISLSVVSQNMCNQILDDIPKIYCRYKNHNRYSSNRNKYTYTSKGDMFDIVVIGIAGQLYLVFLLIVEDKKSLNHNTSKYQSFLDFNKFKDAFYRVYEKHELIDKGLFSSITTEQAIKYFGDRYELKYDNLFIDLDSPLFLLKNDCVVRSGIDIKDSVDWNICTNIRLLDFNLQRIFDPYQTGQRIMQYLTNELVMAKRTDSIISDDIKRDKHGFNKYSFKKNE